MENEPFKITLGGSIEAVKARARLMVAPPEGLPTHREVACNIRLPDGPQAGEMYDPAIDPVHDVVSQELDKAWTRFVLVGAVQTGKSLLLMLPILRALCHARQSVVYSQPTGPKIDEAWTGKMMPVIDSSNYREWMPERGMGSKGSNSLSFVLLRDPKTKVRAGMLYGIPGGGKSEAAQAGVTAPVVINDEVDSYKDRHRIELVAKRADSYGPDARRYYTSTVKHDQASIILGMYGDSTQGRLWFKCPSCGEWQPLEWEQAKYDGTDEITAMTSAAYICAHNACVLGENARFTMHKDRRLVFLGQTVDKEGHVVGTAPRTTTCGVLWTSLDSSLRSLATMAGEHWRATKAMEEGQHGPMRSFYRDQLCREYTGELEEMETSGPLTWQFLQRRTIREKWGPTRPISDRDPADPDQFYYSRHVAPVPQEAQWSVLAIDVQHNRVYWMLRAFDRNATSWIYGWGYEYARRDHEPADVQETRAMLNRVFAAVKTYGQHTDLICAGLDIGDNTETLREWAAGVGAPFRCMKGYTHHLKAEAQDIEGLAYWREDTILMQADAARDMFHVTLRRPIDGAGATHFPFGIGMQDIAIFRHLVSEQTGIDPNTKKRVIIRGGGRNDWLDCGKMTECLIVGFLMELKINESKAPAPIRSETIKHDDDAPNGPVKVASNLQRQRQQAPREEGSMYRISRRHGVYRRGF